MVITDTCVGESLPSSLVSRNVRIAGRRTSVRLEREIWEALVDICQRESATLNQICTHVAASRPDGGFTSNLRVFIMGYFRGQANPAERKPLLHITNASTTGSTANAASVDSATPPATSSGDVLNLSANR